MYMYRTRRWQFHWFGKAVLITADESCGRSFFDTRRRVQPALLGGAPIVNHQYHFDGAQQSLASPPNFARNDPAASRPLRPTLCLASARIKMAQKCVHKGCGKVFADPAEPCVYHPGPPVFHEGQKGKPKSPTRSFSRIPPRLTCVCFSSSY
jgi:hypothetical protein